ncbi:MAG: type VI secretion system contractile sheath large subunit [Pseudomonadota bacterium]
MPDPITFGKLEFNLVADMDTNASAPDPQDPFRILIMGDFTGQENRDIISSGNPLANQRPIRVDRDNFDSLIGKLGVKLALPVLGPTAPPVVIGFSELEDFHPDHLFDRLEVFQALRDTRTSLENPATFAAVAGGLKGVETRAEKTMSPSASKNAPAGKPDPVSGNLLDEIIAQTPGEQTGTDSIAPPSEWHSFLREIVRPHLVSDPHPRQAEMIAAVDSAAGELMRLILHHPDFSALEAAWKALYFLVSRLETDVLLKLYLLDISKTELERDLGSVENLRSTGLFRLLVEQTLETPGTAPWAVLIGNYRFEQNVDDVEFLGRIAKIAKASGAPFIAAASDKMVCQNSLAQTPDPDDWEPAARPDAIQAWLALRKLPEAAYIGLALPRFLLRLPYGADTDPVEAFDFEEISSSSDHESFLWGNAAFACALLLGQSFSSNGWQLRPGDLLDVTNLPLYLYKKDAESKLLPCAETLLTQRAAEMILDNGLMPLLSFLDQDTVRLARFQAITTPLTRLAGRWEE